MCDPPIVRYCNITASALAIYIPLGHSQRSWSWTRQPLGLFCLWLEAEYLSMQTQNRRPIADSTSWSRKCNFISFRSGANWPRLVFAAQTPIRQATRVFSAWCWRTKVLDCAKRARVSLIQEDALCWLFFIFGVGIRFFREMELTVAEASGLIAAGVFVLQVLLPLAIPWALIAFLSNENSILTW